VLLLLGLMGVFAEARIPENTKNPSTKKEAPTVRETLVEEVLENGLIILIKPDNSHPVVSIALTVGAGVSQEGEYCGTGISHFMEHMSFQGSCQRKTSGEVEKEVKSYGGSINAWTGFDNTTYFITLPKENSKKAIRLIKDIVFLPLCKETEFQKEREVILKEINLTKDDPIRRVMRRLWETAYLDHPYRVPVIGYKDLFKGLKREDLLRYHASRYSPDNMILVVSGDVSPDEILKEFKDAFGSEKRSRGSLISPPIERKQNTERTTKNYMETNLGYIALGYHTVELSHPDVYALDVLGILLGEWDGSRLNKALVKDKRLLYTVNTFNYTPKYPGIFIVYGVGDYKNLEDTKEEIIKEVEKIKERGVLSEELDAAQNIVISNYLASLETTGGLARAISQSRFLTGDATFFETYVDKVKEVDSEAIKKVAKKYLSRTNLTTSYLYPEYAKKEDLKSENGKSPDQKPEKTTLSNGTTIIIKEDKRLPKIALVVSFLGGLRVETPENNGISNLTSTMLLKGTEKRKEADITSSIERFGGSISSFSGNSSFGILVEFLSKNKEETLEIVSDIIGNSVFPENEIEKEKEKIYAAIKRQKDGIYSTGFFLAREGLYAEYPFRMRVIGEIDSVKGISKEDIVSFYKKFCVSGNMVISIVGDCKSSDMRKMLEKYFSNIRGGKVQEIARKPKALTERKSIAFKMPREQSLVLVGFRGAKIHDEERIPLKVLCSILSGENGKLYESLRNRLGTSYALGIFSVPSIDTGYIIAYVGTDKRNLKKAKNALLLELKKAEKGSFSEEEVELAKTYLNGMYVISLQSLGHLAQRMALDELYGLGYDAYLKYPEKILAVEKKEVVKAAKKYLDESAYVLVEVVSEKEN